MYLELNISMEEKLKLVNFLRDNNIESKIYNTASEAFCFMEAESRVCECEESIGRTLTDEERKVFVETLAKRLFNTDLVSDLAYNLADQVTKELFAEEAA